MHDLDTKQIATLFASFFLCYMVFTGFPLIYIGLLVPIYAARLFAPKLKTPEFNIALVAYYLVLLHGFIQNLRGTIS